MPKDEQESIAGPGSGSRTRRTMRLIGCNVLTAAVLLIPVELGLRLFDFEFALAPPRVESRRPGDAGPLEPRQGRWRGGFPDSDLLKRIFVVDPDLLWVTPNYPDRVTAARGMHPSVVFMGDSCTQDGRYDEMLQSVIEARNPDSIFSFVNAGTAGWSSWSGLRQLQRDVVPIRPKAVTIYYGWNDHWRNLGLQDKDAARFIEPSGLRTAQLVDKAVFAWMQLFAEPSPHRVSPADFRGNLRRMVRIARDNGIIPILLTAPSSFRPGDSTRPRNFVPLHRRYVQTVREVAAVEDALLVDLYREFNRLSRQDVDRLFWEDGIHLRPEGNRKIAELIDRRLVEADLYPRLIGEEGDETFHAEAEARFQEVLDGARLLIRGRFDVWLDGGRLLYVRDRCVGSDERFSLHVVPADPDDLPEQRREHGFDNLDFDLSRTRLRFMPRCVAARRLPDYPVAAIRTGQFRFVGEDGFDQLWEEEFVFTEEPRPDAGAPR